MIVRETAFAKVNLALHVRGRRADGYHDLETVFAFCEDGDLLEVEDADRLSLTIEGPFSKGLEIEGNLVMKAAQALGSERGAAIRLTKNLPIASGIGGGSADAAAALRSLSKLWQVPLPSLDVQRNLGADVPACVVSQTMRGEGVGERLFAVPSVTGIPILLVNPRIPLSTGAVFGRWDGTDRGALTDWQTGRNDLEAAARAIVPEIAATIDWLVDRPGVTLARMSGSGATCFALFENTVARDAAQAAVAPQYWTMASNLR
ncbi:4-(cytidine 5'-diphospho)-2-C-methyl-D-erythritol kinase [Sphingomonas paeninsulae]|uniref:4-diphosphocytidyl-2-C-methyl-D-erythritol kinase n=1 Tax=Sphingomonas paeninsulae TaxID=2319844 RepID=A0A494TDG5_SPHPE|nr:4-(cytidine 5'-diphospho)-2-C-methyl-D-erythritol kinase [Sphingomonas paeninsulae]AYJ87537.1 4-(cytidine 5'-diphospho)-2-C-methyl-D-erythritol kinase [Sphingomonas paeninsulae]